MNQQPTYIQTHSVGSHEIELEIEDMNATKFLLCLSNHDRIFKLETLRYNAETKRASLKLIPMNGMVPILTPIPESPSQP